MSAADVEAVLAANDVAIGSGRYFSLDEASTLVRRLRSTQVGGVLPRRLFAPPHGTQPAARGPFAASGALHAGLLAALVIVTGLGVNSEPTTQRVSEPARLVFLASPGPGGGGGGGGRRERLPAPAPAVRGQSSLRSPVVVARKVAPRVPETRTVTPPPPSAVVPVPEPQQAPPEPEPQPAPAVVAPVVSAPADPEDRRGVLTDAAETSSSTGPGSGGGTGTGRGTGSGAGDGAGIGDGSTAGIGGGPYRPGAGITAPTLLREVKPVYSEAGRSQGIEGEVVLEVVVRSDGSVGAVRVARGLGAGLDQRAIDAVRQWKFSPARRHGTPVDVMVEIAVEFRLR